MTLQMRVPASQHRLDMSSTTPRPAVAARDLVHPLEAWLRPIVFATLLARLVSTATFPILYTAYGLVVPGAYPLSFSIRGTLQGLVSIRAFAIWLGWATVFALAYRAWPSVRRHVERTGGPMTVGAVFGCVAWLVMHYVVARSSYHIFSMSFVNWLLFVIVLGPVIVWCIHRFRPLPGARLEDTAYALRPGDGW
jgi:hypothetical protein